MTTKRKMVKLHCEKGNHEWERESKRGRIPANCPDHSPTPTPQQEKAFKAMQEGRARKAEASRREGIEEILSHPRNQRCNCGISPDMTDEELKDIESCTSPHFVCGTLDLVRRSVGI